MVLHERCKLGNTWQRLIASLKPRKLTIARETMQLRSFKLFETFWLFFPFFGLLRVPMDFAVVLPKLEKFSNANFKPLLVCKSSLLTSYSPLLIYSAFLHEQYSSSSWGQCTQWSCNFIVSSYFYSDWYVYYVCGPFKLYSHESLIL